MFLLLDVPQKLSYLSVIKVLYLQISSRVLDEE